MVMPGDNVKMSVELVAPVAMEDGLRLLFVKVVVRRCGVVAKILE